MLHLRLFGTPAVSLADSPSHAGGIVTFDTRKATALLAFLAVTGRPQSRDVLAALLWPELEHAKARGALRRTLSVASAAGPALVVEAKSVSVDAGGCTCDVVQFREAAAGDTASWRTAADLAAEPFMAGFSLRDSSTFDDWQAMVGDELAAELSAVLGRLVVDASSRGDRPAAIQFARRRVQVDPLSEPAHVDLMRALAESGDRSSALRQYRSLVRALDRELGVPPLPETIALQEEIRTGSLAVAPPSPPGAPSRSSAGARDRVVVRCVGRSSQRDQLMDAWRGTSSEGVVRAVVGDPGMGRTTLMSAFVEDLEDAVRASGGEAPVVAVLRGVASEQGLAYAAAGDLVRALVDADPGLVSRMGEAGEALSALSPALGLPGGIENNAARRRVLESVRTALASTPTVVVVDDAHLIDAPSAELLAFVARRIPPGVLLVATWPTRTGASPLVDAVREVGGARPITLTPLTVADVDELAGDERLDGADVIQRTGGVPLLVAELVAQLLAESTASPDGVGAVTDVVAARLDAAPETTQQVVAASVVVGTVADPELLRATCGRDEYETVEAIEDAVERGLLVERRELGGYDVPHSLMRQAVLAHLGLARRRLLHGRAADTLARRHGVSPLVTPAGAVARHLVEAGREGEAASWYWQAAQESLKLFAHAEAVEQLRISLALGYDPSEVQPALGGALTRLGRYREALLAFEQAAASGDDDPTHVAELELQIAEVHDRLGEWDLALDRITDAQQLVAADTALGARLETQAALMEYRLGRIDVAEQRARKASELGRALGDDVAGARAANMLGVIAGAGGRLEEALAQLQDAVTLARADGDSDLLVAGLNNLARALGRVGRDHDAVVAVQEAVALAAAEGDRHHEAVLRSHLADLYHALGDEAGAQEQLRASAVALAGVDAADTRPEVWTLVEW